MVGGGGGRRRSGDSSTWWPVEIPAESRGVPYFHLASDGLASRCPQKRGEWEANSSSGLLIIHFTWHDIPGNKTNPWCTSSQTSLTHALLATYLRSVSTAERGANNVDWVTYAVLVDGDWGTYKSCDNNSFNTIVGRMLGIVQMKWECCEICFRLKLLESFIS